MKLSIVVPVYGVEKYILQFAQSLINQINEEVELIVINDGTKDRSIEIFKKYVKDNFLEKNIIWLEQKNQGQSVARNYGISYCKGEYITFLDPDDIVSDDYIVQILNCIVDQPDLIHFNAESFCVKNDQFSKIKKLTLVKDSEIVENSISFLKKIYTRKLWFSWLRVIHRKYLTVDFYPVNVNYQDMMAFPKLYKKVKKIKNLNKELVFYRIHSESSVNGIKPQLFRSAEYGIQLYSNYDNDLDYLIYNQFVELRFDLEQKTKGFYSALSWYIKNVFFESKCNLYSKKFSFLKILNKFIFISIYRFLKAKVK